jgi:SulP family sulfate permease
MFSEQVYAPFMPSLAKLCLLSSATHQLIMSVFSTLPFAVGQVQDAGLIFLQRMTTRIARRLVDEGEPDNVVVSTALTATALSTATLGLCLIFIGRMRLARFMSYLPMPVVGGYLGYIGFFCLEAGISICTGEPFESIADFAQLANWHSFLLCVPALFAGALFCWVARRFEHFAVLPGTMLAVPLLFYIGLGMSGHDLQDARDVGLVGAVREPAEWDHVLDLFDFSVVRWDCLPAQIPIWLGMVVVVGFSSSLDVAAIEMDMAQPLDTDRELITIGMSNTLSGLLGGFAGSYIFSQTIFTYRTKCNTRLIGWIVTAAELTVFFMSADPLMYVPLFFFAATLTFIAIDLMLEWLVEVREKLMWYEYLILLGTFFSIHIFGLNLGLAVGLGLSILSFAISFASERMNVMQRVYKRSRVIRPASQRQVLAVHRDKILCIELRGELNFMSATQALATITENLNMGQEEDATNPSPAAHPTEHGVHGFLKKIFSKRKTHARRNSLSHGASERASLLEHGATNGSVGGVFDSGRSSTTGSAMASPVLGHPPMQAPGNLNEEDVPSFVILDCSLITRIDASAARTCFLPLQRIADQYSVCVVYARLGEEGENLLRVHGALDGEHIALFADVHAALNWCETTLIRAATRGNHEEVWQFSRMAARPSFIEYTGGLTIAGVLRQILDLPESSSHNIELITEYCNEIHFDRGDEVYGVGDPSDRFYVLLKGKVLALDQDLSKPSISLQPGAIFGYVDYQLHQPRSFSVEAGTDCVVCVFERHAVEKLAEERPALCLLLERSVLRHSAMELMGAGGV